MTIHLLIDENDSVTDLTPEEASTRWERLRIMPCDECSERYEGDAIVYHSCP